MKTKLPKVLLAALMATFAYATPITGTIEKSGDIEITEGTFYIGDGITETNLTLNGSLYPHGDNATIIINKATVEATGDTLVGNAADGGTLIIDNESNVDLSASETFAIGYCTNNDKHRELTVKGGSTLIGGHNNLWIFNGTLNVKDSGTEAYFASTDNGTLYNFRTLLCYFEGNTATVNVSNGAKATFSASQFVANYSGKSTSNIHVDGLGSELIQTEKTKSTDYHYDVGASGNWTWKKDATSTIGKDCVAGWYDVDSSRPESTKYKGEQTITVTYLCDGGTNKVGCKTSTVNNTTTNISATNGGHIKFESQLTYIGHFLDRQQGKTNKQASFFIDEQSSISFERLHIYADTTISNTGNFFVNGDMEIFGGCTITLNLTSVHTEKAIITLGDSASVIFKTNLANVDLSEAPSTEKATFTDFNTITFNIEGCQNFKAGQQFILFNKAFQQGDGNANQRATTTPAVTLNIIGTNAEVAIVDGQTVITLLEDIFVGRDPLADVLGAAAWGVQKSSQAFTGTLWGGRTNAVVLNTCTSTSSDEKGNVVSTTLPTGRTIAWGTAYGQFSEIDSCCDAAGADYNIYGAAIGAEHQFASGRSVGAALGYDWGKVSPFHAASFDQESKHAAIYGRAGQWKLGTQGALAVDLSAAVGQTESELPVGDVEQDSLQLDARVSYIYALTDKTSISAFAGLQYYAQSDDSTANVEVGSAQYLRSLAGVGINHAVTAQTTVFAEASVYNDAMRHNPEVMVDGFTYGVANPGRLGGSITAGAAYELNANWTLRGSYRFDAAKHSTEHSVNAGAVYKF